MSPQTLAVADWLAADGHGGPDSLRSTAGKAYVELATPAWLPSMLATGCLEVRTGPDVDLLSERTVLLTEVLGPLWAMLLLRELAWSCHRVSSALKGVPWARAQRLQLARDTDAAALFLHQDAELRAALLTVYLADHNLPPVRPWFTRVLLDKDPPGSAW